MKINYNKSLGSVYLLQYHLILVVKYRKPVIDDKVCERLREIFKYIAKEPAYQLEVIEFNHDKDHIHILFQAKPSSQMLKFINAYKSASSRLIKNEFNEVRRELYQSAFWSGSYFMATTGGVTLDILKQYIEEQGIEDNRPKRKNKPRKNKTDIPNGNN